MNRKITNVSLSVFFLLVLIAFVSMVVSAATVSINYPYTGSFLTASQAGNGTHINVNISVNTLAIGDMNVTNVSLSYRTAPGGAWFPVGMNDTVNKTGDKGNTTYSIAWNISTLTDGTTYELNATAFNQTVAIGVATLTGITLDHTNPAVTILEILEKGTSTSKSKFFFGEEILIRCTRSDATAGFNNTNISVFAPNVGRPEIIVLTNKIGTVAEAVEEIFKGTQQLGEYVVACSTRDRAGLVNASINGTFEVITKPPQGSTRPAGFVNPVGTKIISGEADLGRLTPEKATSVQLKTSTRVRLDVQGTTYTIIVKSFTEDALTLQVGSDEVTVSKGEPMELDLDNDGTNDMKVTYHKQFKKGSSATADVTFEAVTTPVKAPTKPSEPSESTTTEKAPTQQSAAGSLLVAIIVIVVIIVVGYFLIKGKKK